MIRYRRLHVTRYVCTYVRIRTGQVVALRYVEYIEYIPTLYVRIALGAGYDAALVADRAFWTYICMYSTHCMSLMEVLVRGRKVLCTDQERGRSVVLHTVLTQCALVTVETLAIDNRATEDEIPDYIYVHIDTSHVPPPPVVKCLGTYAGTY